MAEFQLMSKDSLPSLEGKNRETERDALSRAGRQLKTGTKIEI